MIKKIFYFTFCVFMTFVCFAQGNEQKGYIANHAEFAAKERKAGTTMIHKNSKYISLGNVLRDLVIYEKPKALTRWSNPYNMSYYKYYYIDIEFDTSQNADAKERMIYIITLLSDEWETYRGARIGMSVSDVVELYGVPEKNENGSLRYYNDDFDHLELTFYYDKKNVIRRIVIAMGT